MVDENVLRIRAEDIRIRTEGAGDQWRWAELNAEDLPDLRVERALWRWSSVSFWTFEINQHPLLLLKVWKVGVLKGSER